ncbi:MAG: acyltransferase PapA5 [Firmicutes bacterium ADurb.Bin419]|nr:MAG: acyltransferase PapA5 [Firmicutes bacterium ADurb.Bin419]
MKFKLGNNSINPSKTLSDVTSFYKKINKTFARHTPSTGAMPGNLDIIPAYAHDYGNYVAKYGMGNFQIQVVMKLDGKLNFDKLSRAVRLSVDTEPILGCRFVEHNPPYFKRLEDIDNTKFCFMEESENAEEAVHRFLESRLDMDHDPMVKVKLIRSIEHDTLCIKLNHTCSDGSGAKDYILLLSHIYSCLDRYGSYLPKPRVRSRNDHKKLFKNLGIKYPELDNSAVESPKTAWPFRWLSGGQKDITPFVICQLRNGQLDILSKYSKKKGVTINDLILTALYRAMFKMTKPPYGVPMDMGLTVDLRRYLPGNKAEAIRNFSGGIILRIARLFGEPFEGTLLRVKSVMNRKKVKNPGYQCATSAERAEKMNFLQYLAFSKFISNVSEITSQSCFFCSPGLSNVGVISKSPIIFGKNVVTEAYFIPPVVRPPAILLVASSYNGIMTLAVGYYKGSIDRRIYEKLLNKIIKELIEGCK